MIKILLTISMLFVGSSIFYLGYWVSKSGISKKRDIASLDCSKGNPCHIYIDGSIQLENKGTLSKKPLKIKIED